MNVFWGYLSRGCPAVADTRRSRSWPVWDPEEVYGGGENVSIESVAAELPAQTRSEHNPGAELFFGSIRERAAVGEGQRAVPWRIPREYYLLLLPGEKETSVTDGMSSPGSPRPGKRS